MGRRWTKPRSTRRKRYARRNLNRRRAYRRRRRRRRRRRFVPRINYFACFPRRRRVVPKYVEEFTLDPGLNDVVTHSFRTGVPAMPNAAILPTATAGAGFGTQPYGWAEWGALYERCTCLGSRIKVTYIPAYGSETALLPVAWGVYRESDLESVPTNMRTSIGFRTLGIPFKWGTARTGYSSSGRVNNYMTARWSARKASGKIKLSLRDADFTTKVLNFNFATAMPTNDQYWESTPNSFAETFPVVGTDDIDPDMVHNDFYNVYCQGSNSAVNANARYFRAEISYICVFHDVKVPTAPT